ncbi:hypothetical protein GCM10009087_51270 [Sphingomonas oligophenolica]|uniref:SMP-30/Gluconolactonase/LRE-like region domain-containing protein n=1 Tax=Sphingomonas oligophenolica TaxID=301154 RepID=A0ABU9Y662_9SPHN
MFAATGSPVQARSEAAAPAESAPTDACGPVDGLKFVCGLKKPEDLVRVPDTKWLIASGVAPGARLSLVDTTEKVTKPLFTGGPAQIRPDTALYPHCPGPPDAAGFAPHGLALRPGTAPGLYRLYVVSHLALEGIQVFALDARGAEPSVTWTGCVPFPKGMVGNAVTALHDGTILATIRGDIAFKGPKASSSGITVGAVASWTPGDAGFRQIPGTQMFGPNGIEASLDEKEFYVVSVDSGSVLIYSRAHPGKPVRQSAAPLTSLDNIHWEDGHLIAAGKMADEPACGGTRQQVVNSGQGIHDCIRGYAAVELNPVSMQWRVIAYAEPNPAFDGVATAVPVGNTLWLSSFLNDRVGYRPLPGTK